jgi:hypothetical protein
MITTSTTAPSVPDTSTPAAGRSAPEGARHRPSHRTIGLLAALVVAGAGSTTWVLASRPDVPPASDPVQIVEDGRWGGPDVFEPRTPPVPRVGSADSLERQAA